MLRSIPATLTLTAFLLAACGGEPQGAGGPATQSPQATEPRAVERPRAVGEVEQRVAPDRPPVFVFALDGADWQQLEPLIEAGSMPNLRRLRSEGAWGVLRSEKPTLSPLLWTTMMTGVSPLEHGILDFSRFRPGSGLREPITSDERRAPAIWNLATWAGREVDVLGLWATYPAEAIRGVLVSDRLFGFLNLEEEPPPGAIYPPEREAWARAELAEVWRRTGYAAVREYLPWLSEAEYRENAESDRPYGHPISALRRILVETRLYDSLAESLLSETEPDLLVLYLQGTDSIGHVFAAFAPPRQPSVDAVDYERYHEVPERYFREIDALLGRWIERADRLGAALVLVSDHGFTWAEGRPETMSSFDNATAAQWHRQEGIWLVRAAGAAPGRAGDADLYQVFPTLVSLLGLPAAAGAPGAPFPGVAPPATPPFDYAAVYAELAERRRRGATEAPAELSERAATEEIAKLQALGYIGAGEVASAPEAVLASGSTRSPGSYNNEGIVLQGAGRDAEARAAFERAIELDPKLASALWNLSDQLYSEGEFDRADELLVRAVGEGLPEGRRFLVGRAIGYQRAGQLARSVALLDGAVRVRPEVKDFWLFRGRYRVEAGECAEAVADFARAAALDPGDPTVFASSALAHLCRGDRAAATADFRRSLALDPNQPKLRAMLAQLAGG